MTFTVPELPRPSGAYRWFYADVSAGDWTCVCIFMIGGPFSPRYSARARRGGLPVQHSAVNFALYHRGRRKTWVLSEYPQADLDGGVLRIGGSRLWYEGSTLRIVIDERPVLFGRRVRASLDLLAQSPRGEPLRLSPGEEHFWAPLAARASAHLIVPDENLAEVGHGYHDTNWGSVMLGAGLPRWQWTRVHGPEATHIRYELPDEAPLLVEATSDELTVARGAPVSQTQTLTGWGLRIPDQLVGAVERLPTNAVLESSPFYARLEGRAGEHHALAEVADFRRFHSPLIRWMAHFRTRKEAKR